ncbi:non-ribosomal peptide synthetase [Acetobacter indonesiensis]|uniref:non-ribosomal peptide synthetase n=1 Tax=Acetobacter indonesiensis TaxID=104101 RepID=UPI000A3C9AEA|nr:non-ribosomal peptide synthetase [Acetobacter indonesiensis]
MSGKTLQETHLPLTTAQRGAWMGTLLRTQGGTFNIAEAVEILGPVDPALFRAALVQVAQEAETTRVSIRMGADGPYQVILPTLRCPLPFVDFSTRPDAAVQAQHWMMERISQPVDLAEDPLWTCALIKLSADSFIWFHCCHHIALDGFSGGLIVARVAELYNAMVEGREPAPCTFLPLERLVAQEAAYRTSPRREKDQAYWQHQLAAPPEAVTLASPLPPSVPEEPLQRLGFVERNVLVPPAMVGQMQGLAQQAGVTLPQMLTALLSTYIFRMTGQEDLTLGMPVTGRTDREMRRVPGMAANAVVLRFAMAYTLGFSEILLQARRALHGALRHQAFRYEDLRRVLGFHDTQQHLSRIGINIEPFDYHLSFGGSPARNRNLSNGMMEDLTFFVFDRQDGQGLALCLYANPTLYDGPTLERHLRHVMRLIKAILTDPAQPIGAYPLLDAAEGKALLADETATACNWGPRALVADLARHAAYAPTTTAVTDGRGPVSYAALLHAVQGLAEHLMACGIGPGDVVGLMLPRDRRQVIGMLATMTAGAAWLSLDSCGPRERNAVIIANARPALFLTEDILPTGLPDGSAVLGLAEDGTPATVFSNPDAQRAPVVPQDTAYVIYTSGTTGTPKGVVVPWSALTNLLCTMQDKLALGAQECWLSVTSVTFDISILELLLPLQAGAHLVLARRETVTDPTLLSAIVQHYGVTLMQATPTLWQMLVGAGQGQCLAQVRVLSGGEPLPVPLARTLQKHARAVYNVYGPTETTIWSTFHAVIAEDGSRGQPIPAGRPLANTQCYVLAPGGGLLPVGTPGQLAIAGAGVATGYLDRPDLTQAVFRPDPFSKIPHARLYLTGDRAVRQPDGTITVLGRTDAQIKIKGVRAEPAEIEAALLTLPGIVQAAVRVWPKAQGPVLVAYLVPAAAAQAETITPEEEAQNFALFRIHLQGLLPAQMVPSRFVVLAVLPLTASGKLNRKMLPEPEDAEHTPQYESPQTAQEQLLFTLWSDILERKDFGINENFFDLGGDSLAAVQVATALTEQGYELPVVSLFGAPTIARLAPLLQHQHAVPDMFEETVVPLRAEGTGQPIFCFPPILGVSLGFTALLPHLPAERPVYGLQDMGLLHGPHRPQTIQQLAELYLEQIRALQPHGPYSFVGWSMGGLVAHAVAARLMAEGEPLSALVMLDTYPLHDPAALEAGQDLARMDDTWLVKNAIAMLGIDFSENMPETLDDLADRIVEIMLPEAQAFVQDEAAFSTLLQTIRQGVSHNLEMMRNWQPQRVQADLLFLRATQRGTEDVGDNPAFWQNYITGKLMVTDINCTHMEMLDPENAPVIADQLIEFERRKPDRLKGCLNSQQ